MRIETVKTLLEIIISNHFSVLFECTEQGYEIMHNWRVPECTVLVKRGFIVVCKLECTVRFTDDVTGAQQYKNNNKTSADANVFLYSSSFAPVMPVMPSVIPYRLSYLPWSV